MTQLEAFGRPRALLVAGVLISVGLTAFGIALASRPGKPVDASCQQMDAAMVTRFKTSSDRANEPAGAAADRAMTTIAAARRLCESGDVRTARTLYQRADRALTRFQPATQPGEE